MPRCVEVHSGVSRRAEECVQVFSGVRRNVVVCPGGMFRCGEECRGVFRCV